MSNTSKNDLDEWKSYCNVCLLPLVLTCQVLAVMFVSGPYVFFMFSL